MNLSIPAVAEPTINQHRYLNYNTYLERVFGEKVRKLSVNSGFTCPTRDGTKGIGGCTYCNNNSFSPSYCQSSISITKQLDEGIAFFKRRNKINKYLAYFQSYTNTYGSIDQLKALYEEALNHPQVNGLVIGTRPDCISDEVLNLLTSLSNQYFISLEIGIESTLDRTLEHVNRGHTYAESKTAIINANKRGLQVGAHLILGLPGETREEMLSHATELSTLPIHSLKLHQLQIVKQTVMASEYKRDPSMFTLFSAEEYVVLITDFLQRLRPGIYIERFISESPKQLLIVPQWNGLRNVDMIRLVNKRMRETNTWQGKLYQEGNSNEF